MGLLFYQLEFAIQVVKVCEIIPHLWRSSAYHNRLHQTLQLLHRCWWWWYYKLSRQWVVLPVMMMMIIL